MPKKAYNIIWCGLFLFIDQILKWHSLNRWTTHHLATNYLGWYPFKNFGVAFGIPLPNILMVIFSVPVMLFILYLALQTKSLIKHLALCLIIFGAVSNFIDRLVYKFTVDYFLIFTGIINIADIMIVLGFTIHFFSIYKHTEGYVSKT